MYFLQYQFAWILSRTQTIEDKAVYERAIQAFHNNNIDISGFSMTHQGSDCVYQV